MLAVSCVFEARAQQSWWVFFTDKKETSFDPYSYFAPEAIERRVKLGISLYDSTDFPVNQTYVEAVRAIVDSVGHQTRWFNGVGVNANETEVAQLRQLPFVREVIPQPELIYKPAMANCVPDTVIDDDEGEERMVHQQIDPLNGKLFEDHGKKGKGVIIGVIDVGFHGVDVHPAFGQLRFNNQIRASFDFVKDNADVYSTKADHGTMVLSCIAGEVNGTQMGLAPEATFLLARIANAWTSQTHGEENFVAAVEWADKQGVMIINCSDGPDHSSYFPEQVDGKTSLMTRTSNLAARKGILVIAAAGNEGETDDPFLLPPADADSALSVTALDDDGYIASYSSYGPTPDFRRKPDVCSPGTAVVANGSGEYEVAEGTSFSAPLLVGFAACLVQMYPDLSAMQLMDSLRRSASLYPYYDYSHGYGVPQATYFFDTLAAPPATFTIERVDNSAKIVISEKFRASLDDEKAALLFYSLQDENGKIYKYEAWDMRRASKIVIHESELRAGVSIHVSYKGYYAALTF